MTRLVSSSRWQTNVPHEVGAFINSVGHHSRLEPPGVDPDSGKRADGECNSLLRGGNSVYWDVNTYAVTTGTDADAREATFPGLAADKHEYAKTRTVTSQCVHKTRKDVDGAEQAYRAAIQADPRHPKVLNTG